MQDKQHNISQDVN